MPPEPRPHPPDALSPLSDYTPDEIAEFLHLKPFQGKQIFRWLHQKKVFDFDAMTDLSKPLRETLKDTCLPAQLERVHLAESPRSGTKKILFQLRDGETIESVYLTDRNRVTLCVSSQAGCALACAFCATGRTVFRRNLSAGEIVEQVLHLLEGPEREQDDFGNRRDDRTPNIVYMGMGEPFRNYDAVMKSIRLLMMPDGLGIGARKITLSTVGDVTGIRRFARENGQMRLAISLHAANDNLRSRLIPLNRTAPLAELMRATRYYVATTGRRPSFEWVLLDGVNDSLKDARELAGLIEGIPASVNLIPYNPVPGVSYQPSPRKKCQVFLDALAQAGITATLRRERGVDIDAACGQLRSRNLPSPG